MCLAEFSVYSNLKPCASTDKSWPGHFVARWCVGCKPETADEVFQVRKDEPTPRIGAGLHHTP
jgi:hypothetical protein